MGNDKILLNLAKSKVEKQTSELKVFTASRKLLAYVVQATEKSPKKFKATFVDRLRNLVLSSNGNLIRANLCRLDEISRRIDRKNYQIKAYEDLKELENLSFLSVECKCILPKQFEQISKLISEVLTLLSAWMKNDKLRIEHL